MEPVVIGVDVGTGSARAGAFDCKGRLLGSASHDIAIHRPGADIVEQDSENIWRAVCSTVRTSLAKARVPPAAVRGIGFDATCSLVLRDRNLRPLGASPGGMAHWDTIVWMDHRAKAEAKAATASGARVLDYVGGVMSPEMETPKLAWLKREHPAAWGAMGRAFDLADFLTWRASGIDRRSVCTLTCKWTYLAHEETPWDEAYLRVMDLEDLGAQTGVTSNVVPVGTPIGHLTPAAARELGLAESVIVGAGLIDAHAGALGTIGPHLDRSLDQRVAMIAGTSTCLMALSREPRFIGGVWGPCFHAIVDGWWLNEGGQSISGAVLDYVLALHPAARDLGASAHAALADRLLDGYPAAGDPAPRLHILPDFHGNRSPLADPDALGVISGLTTDLGEASLTNLYWAAACAIACGARHIIEAMNAEGYDIQTLHLSGGHAMSRLLPRLYADVTGCGVAISSCPEPVLLGAAMTGAVASGLYPDLVAAGSAMGGTATLIPPDPGTRDLHERRYLTFLALHRHRQEIDRIMSDDAGTER